jgi:type II secretory ATPase GspE/PulE/Tfp pilus assembly ATPase PilB-like protein
VVLSTLHTNDSFSAVIRLLDLGIPGYLISASVSGILAQRLVRKLCSCHTYQAATPAFTARMEQLGMSDPPSRMAVANGCEKCNETGYSGRVGIYELLRLDDSIRSIVRANGSVDQIRSTARVNGMRLMQENALEKIRLGVTTLEEILRVVPVEANLHAECEQCRNRILPTFNFCPNCGSKCVSEPLSIHSRSRELVPEGSL